MVGWSRLVRCHAPPVGVGAMRLTYEPGDSIMPATLPPVVPCMVVEWRCHAPPGMEKPGWAYVAEAYPISIPPRCYGCRCHAP